MADAGRFLIRSIVISATTNIHLLILALGLAMVQTLLSGCAPVSRPEQSEQLLPQLLRARSGVLRQVLENGNRHKLQILYTQIDRDDQNTPQFRSHAYGLNTDRYFYPASTVKFPAAVLSLEKINDLGIAGLTKYTSLRIDSAYTRQTHVTSDSTAENGLPSIAHYIRKIFLVSDNDAFNRLFEFLGQAELNQKLRDKGYQDVQIIRRLSIATEPDENRHTNPFTFFNGDDILYRQPAAVNPLQPKIEMSDVRQGKGYMSAGRLIKEPIDFSYSNYFPIKSQQAILKAVLFPESVPPEQRFNLTDDDYRFLYRNMGMRPAESGIASYSDTSIYNDSYVKFFMFGDSKQPMPPHIRILSKSGQAYGYLIDNAYVVDFKNKLEFLLTTVLQVNANQIYNDDRYEYDEIGIPFLSELGTTIYEYELKRLRTRVPDLSKFDLF